MAAGWEHYLERWTGGGLIDPSTAERIRAFEAKEDRAPGLRWPVVLALGLGGLLLGAGVLLFVAAHWDTFSPAERFGLVLLMVVLFHAAGALVAESFPALSSTLHAIGSVCLGAGIFLAGQIFNLQEHWPGGVLLWAIGAWVGWAMLRDWPQGALVAVLTPAWLVSEWMEATRGWTGSGRIVSEGLLLLAITYLTALLPEHKTTVRRMLMWIGALAFIPCTALTVASGGIYVGPLALPGSYDAIGWVVALVVPLGLAAWLRRRTAWANCVAALWVIGLGATTVSRSSGLAAYAMCALGAVGLIAWGLWEARKERINLGVAGFALTVLAFYFSAVMDKLGRSASLIGLGLLFLLGGWLFEKARRRLVARLEQGAA